MNYKIELSPNFKKEAKKLLKKYASLRTELAELGEKLAENPNIGIALGNDIYKIRLAILSKNKGKAGGARVIFFIKVVDKTVFLISIYSKSEKENISDNEIKNLLHEIS